MGLEVSGLLNLGLSTKIKLKKAKKSLRRQILDSMFLIASVTEIRDSYTAGHLARIQGYSYALAVHLSRREQYRETIDTIFIENLYVASALHDVGKVGIPDSILIKPGVLTDDEFITMQSHATLGGKILEGHEYLKLAYEVAHFHHEKWDGTGYPCKLKGNDIPISARIVALADVYDALRSERSYKKAFNHKKAVSIILDGSGKHFDPDVVDAFISTENKFEQIRKEAQKIKCVKEI